MCNLSMVSSPSLNQPRIVSVCGPMLISGGPEMHVSQSIQLIFKYFVTETYYFGRCHPLQDHVPLCSDKLWQATTRQSPNIWLTPTMQSQNMWLTPTMQSPNSSLRAQRSKSWQSRDLQNECEGAQLRLPVYRSGIFFKSGVLSCRLVTIFAAEKWLWWPDNIGEHNVNTARQ